MNVKVSVQHASHTSANFNPKPFPSHSVYFISSSSVSYSTRVQPKSSLVDHCIFFSSRRRHTRFDCDWSSDVCSSDLTLFTDFKSNTTGAIGGLFEKMFHYFQFKQDEYMEHYHLRSNVESTFSAVKRKFGDSDRKSVV